MAIRTLALVLMIFTLPLMTRSQQSEQKAQALLKRLSLDEKIGQMVQVDYGAIKNTPDDIAKYSIGSILWGGDAEPDDISAQGWKSVVTTFQQYAEKSKQKIPLIFGVDAVHGHNNVDGAVIFPHNIGLGATRNPELVQRVGEVTAKELQATGIQWDFAPCIAVARDERWGRTYESYGEDPKLVGELGAAYVRGLEEDGHTISSTKHFLGDGGTSGGKDQGNTEMDEQTLRKIHLPGYIDAIKAGTKTIMVSYSSWNGKKMHANRYLLTDVLKKELGFQGFLISDWAAIDQLSPDYKMDIELSINAGLDMIMIPNGPGRKNNYVQFITLLKELVAEKKVSKERIDDAVLRILKVKFDVGLFEKQNDNKKLLSEFGNKEHRDVAREAVRQSLVLLKNDAGTLPLSKNLKRILVTGNGADNIGMQCGGWTISWLGKQGTTISGGTSILDGIRKVVSPNTEVVYSVDGSGLPLSDTVDAVVVVVGETPYAEALGDRELLSMNLEDEILIRRAKNRNAPIIVILLSGRPLIITTALHHSDAFVAAWLPGTEGAGIADVLFGDFPFAGKLPHSWPRTMTQIPINVGDVNYDPLFPYGYGLQYK